MQFCYKNAFQLSTAIIVSNVFSVEDFFQFDSPRDGQSHYHFAAILL